MKRSYKKTLLILSIALVLAYITNIFFKKNYGVAANMDVCLPFKVSVYQKEIPETIARNNIVFFPMPKETSYIKKGKALAKQVRCIPHQKIYNIGNKFYCDNFLLCEAMKTDSKGKPVKHIEINTTLQKNEYFVLGTHPKSYDSRYWGTIKKENLTGVSIWEF